MAHYRWVEPGLKGRRGALCLTREGARRDGVRTAQRVGVAKMGDGQIAQLWRSLEGAGWRVEEVTG